VLFETGNEDFFAHLVDAFSSLFGRYIIDAYHSLRIKSGLLDQKLVSEYLEKNGKNLVFLHCSIFPQVDCKNDDCVAEHICVLSSGQSDLIENSIKKQKANALRVGCLSSTERVGVQQLYEYFETPQLQKWEIIKIKTGNDHDAFLRLYLQGTDNRGKGTSDFMYVRADDPSDYDYFSRHTRLKNVTSCIEPQKI
jgi:hypothetical protein